MPRTAPPPDETPHVPRWSRRKEARRGELIDAALDLFVERGFAATRADDVAARAGVSKGTMYLYFTNKEDLFKAVVREAIVPSIHEAADLIEHFAGTTPELLRLIMFAWWDKIGNSRAAGIVKLIMAEANNFPELARFYYEEVIAPGTNLFHSMLSRGVKRGEFRPIDVAMTTEALMAPMVMLIMWRHSIGPCAQKPMPDPALYIDHVVDLALRGLQITPPEVRRP